MSKPVAIALICACLIRTGAAKEYYFHNRQGDDANPGSREEPFKTLERMNQLNLERGDAVYFARGTSYYGSVKLSIPTKVAELNEDANKPVHVGNYGEGRLPRFCNPEWTRHFGNVFFVEGEHVILDGLHFHNGPAVPEGIKADEGVRKTGAVFLGDSARHITVRNCEFFNSPIGVQSYGQHCLITRNHFHDCNNWLQHPHWGAIAIMIATSNHEISYNRIENYVSLGGAYGADGGGIELDGPIKKENIDIHHNISVGNEGFLEFYDRDVDIRNVRVHHNISDDFQQFIFLWHGRDVLIEHNTVLCLKPMNSQSRTVFVLRRNNVDDIVIRNNIFVTADGLQVFGLGGVHRWPQDFNQPHSHNLFWSIDGSTEDPSGSPLEKGEIIADPMFVDIENRDLRLREGSPAIDAGADLGYQLDFENKRLPCGDRPDIGAFEYCENQGEQK